MSAIRALRQLAGPSSRAFVARNSTRSFARAALPAARRVTAAPATRAFSVSARRFGEGACEYSQVNFCNERTSSLTVDVSIAADLSLAQKLSEELKYEVESGAVDPEFLETFKSSGVWQIADVTGNDEVTLTRSFGNEKCVHVISSEREFAINVPVQHPYDVLHHGRTGAARECV